MKNFFIWILLALIAVAFTWHVVSWSEQNGKLAMPPDYDDSHSLVEGAVRLLNFRIVGLERLGMNIAFGIPIRFYTITGQQRCSRCLEFTKRCLIGLTRCFFLVS